MAGTDDGRPRIGACGWIAVGASGGVCRLTVRDLPWNCTIVTHEIRRCRSAPSSSTSAPIGIAPGRLDRAF
jgi:hypothetical protein